MTLFMSCHLLRGTNNTLNKIKVYNFETISKKNLCLFPKLLLGLMYRGCTWLLAFVVLHLFNAYYSFLSFQFISPTCWHTIVHTRDINLVLY